MSKDIKNISNKTVTEPQFHIHEFREHSRELFGVKPEILDGAFYNTKKLKFTKAEVKQGITAFMEREVK